MNQLEMELEQLRKKALKSSIVPIVMVVLAFLFFVLFPPVSIALIVVAILLVIFVSSKRSKAYAAAYKQSVVKDALCEIFTDVSFYENEGINKDIIRNTQMMTTGDRFSSNDLVMGRYKSIPFMQSDVHIEDRHTDSDGDTTYTTIFRGRWMIFEFNKNFSCDLQVVSRGFSGNMRKGGIFSFFGSKDSPKMSKVELENTEFNKIFNVFAQSQQEAFYILTPHIMQSLIELYNNSKAPLMLLFVNGQLHVASQTGKDAFEPSIFRKVNLEYDRQRIIGDIAVITSFADALRLENTIYKKEN